MGVIFLTGMLTKTRTSLIWTRMKANMRLITYRSTRLEEIDRSPLNYGKQPYRTDQTSSTKEMRI